MKKLLLLICYIAVSSGSMVQVDPLVYLRCDSNDIYDRAFWLNLKHVGADNLFTYFSTGVSSRRTEQLYDYVSFPQLPNISFPLILNVATDSVSSLQDAFITAQPRFTNVDAPAACINGGVVRCSSATTLTVDGATVSLQGLRSFRFRESVGVGASCKVSCYRSPMMEPIMITPKVSASIFYHLPDGVIGLTRGRYEVGQPSLEGAVGLCWADVKFHNEIIKLRQLNLEGVIDGISAKSYGEAFIPTNRQKRDARSFFVKVRRYVTKLLPGFKASAMKGVELFTDEVVKSLTERTRSKRQVQTGSSYIDNVEIIDYSVPEVYSPRAIQNPHSGLMARLLNSTIGETDRAKVLYYSSWFYGEYTLDKAKDFSRSKDCVVGYLGDMIVAGRKGTNLVSFGSMGSCGSVGCASRIGSCSGSSSVYTLELPQYSLDLLQLCDDEDCPNAMENSIGGLVLNGFYNMKLTEQIDKLVDNDKDQDRTNVESGVFMAGTILSALTSVMFHRQ